MRRLLAACNTFKTLSVLILKKLDLQSNPHLLLSTYSHVRMINALDNIVFASGMGEDEKIGYLCRVNQLLLDHQAYHVLDYLLARCCNYQSPALSSPNLGGVLEQMMFPAPASYQMKRSPITHLFLLRFMVEQAVNTQAVSDEKMLTKMKQIRKWSDSHLLSLLGKITKYRSGRDQVVRLQECLPREFVRVQSDTDEFNDVSHAAKRSDEFLQNIGVLTWLKHFERVNAPASNQSPRLSY